MSHALQGGDGPSKEEERRAEKEREQSQKVRKADWLKQIDLVDWNSIDVLCLGMAHDQAQFDVMGLHMPCTSRCPMLAWASACWQAPHRGRLALLQNTAATLPAGCAGHPCARQVLPHQVALKL
jgi:hypothetical protein